MSIALRKRRFTADEYQRMGQTGILREGDRVELIDGEVIAMAPIGSRHNAAVARATRALIIAAADGGIVLPQGSVRLDMYHEPQPDLVLMRPRADYYASRLAGPADILVIVEIADTSLRYDRDIKSGIYARLGVVEYWLVDLDAGAVTVSSDPRDGSYQVVGQKHRGESIAPRLLPECVIAVADLLAE